MKLQDLFEAKSVTWVEPDFEYEYEEVTHQAGVKAFFKSKKKWLELSKQGKRQTLSKPQVNDLQNHTAPKQEWKNLEDDKRARVEKQFAAGKVELPIVLWDAKHSMMYLLGGNTRLNYSNNNGFGREVWVINTPDLENYL